MKDISKSHGRKKTTGRGEGVLVRLQPELLASLDAWTRRQKDSLSRPEAIRRILVQVLARKPAPRSDSRSRSSRRQHAEGMAAAVVERALSGTRQPDAVKAKRKKALTKVPAELRRAAPKKRSRAAAIPIDKLNASNDA